VTNTEPEDRSTDTNTLAIHIDAIDGGLDSSLILLDSSVRRCRDLDPAAVQLIDPETGTASTATTAATIEWIASELEGVTELLQAAYTRMNAVNARARLLYPRV